VRHRIVVGDVLFEVVSQDAPLRSCVAETSRLAAPDLDAEPNGTGTRLTIVENGFVKNPIFRTMGALFFSPSATIDEYLRALARKLGDTAEPRRVESRAPGRP
jgi:hypothetical protein